MDLEGQRGGRAHHGLISVRWGGRRGGGLLRQRCVLPAELCSGRLALDLGPLRCGAAVHVDQLGVGPGEYGIAGRACNLASDSGSGGPVRESAQSLVHLAASPLMEIEFHRELLNII